MQMKAGWLVIFTKGWLVSYLCKRSASLVSLTKGWLALSLEKITPYLLF